MSENTAAVKPALTDSQQFLYDQLSEMLKVAHDGLTPYNHLPMGSEHIQVREPGRQPGREYSWPHYLSYCLSRTEEWYYMTFSGQLIVMHFDAHDDGSDHNYATAVDLDDLVRDPNNHQEIVWIISGLEHLIKKVHPNK